MSENVAIRMSGVVGSGSVNPLTGNLIVWQGCYEGGLPILFEVLGQTGVDGVPYVTQNGQQKYRRIFIRRVKCHLDNGEIIAEFENKKP